MFDIVICHGPNDDSMLELNLNYNKKNIIGYNNIYIITHDINLARDDCIIIHESIFPFSINILKEYSYIPDTFALISNEILNLFINCNTFTYISNETFTF